MINIERELGEGFILRIIDNTTGASLVEMILTLSDAEIRVNIY